jgi:3-hydroxyisobutyrate dehydrogenase
MNPLRIGWIGVGAMGRPMCLNLLKAGYPVMVFDKTASQCEPVVAAGAAMAASPKELMAAVDVVFSTIFNDEGLRDIVMSEDGLLAGAAGAGIHVDMSTVSPDVSATVAQALAQRGVQYLRAPVSGTVSLAANAQLSSYVSGPSRPCARSWPVSLRGKPMSGRPKRRASSSS